MKSRILLCAVAAAATLALPTTSEAGGVAGYISKYYVSMSTNLPFRVFMATPPADCPSDFLYIEWSEPNYPTYVSGLIAAYSQHKSVTINYAIGSGGYCRIMEYEVRD